MVGLLYSQPPAGRTDIFFAILPCSLPFRLLLLSRAGGTVVSLSKSKSKSNQNDGWIDQLFKVDIASEVFRGDEKLAIPPFLVLATDGIWDETSANTVVDEVGAVPRRAVRSLVCMTRRQIQKQTSKCLRSDHCGLL